MNSIDEVSKSIGRLQGEVEGLQRSVIALTSSVNDLLVFKWKAAGAMIFAGGLVELLHLFVQKS